MDEMLLVYTTWPNVETAQAAGEAAIAARLAACANILGATWTVLRDASKRRAIWLSLLALSWFWTIGATLLTEFPIVARDTLGSGGSVLTLLLAVFSLGTGAGSIGCAHLLKGEVSPRHVPFAAFGISLFCWDFAHTAAAAGTLPDAWAVLQSPAGWHLLVDLALLAACGGLFSVPLYAIIRDSSAPADSEPRVVRCGVGGDQPEVIATRGDRSAGPATALT